MPNRAGPPPRRLPLPILGFLPGAGASRPFGRASLTRRGGPAGVARLVALSVLAAACGGGGGNPVAPPPPVDPPPAGRPSLPAVYRPTGRSAAGDVFVHLFEWKWTDIASECETVLGPAGYAAVQVSPPQEHSLVPGAPWSERYQPVSYSLEKSRSGTRAEFVDMVARCKAVGVGIYVDAVINHMTNYPSPGVGSNGTSYSKYSYPGLYTQADFHPVCPLLDYTSAAIVQDCELLGLPDLNTGSASVRQKIADYLIGLGRIGVAGFRIDAAKHIQQVELDSILALVNRAAVSDGRPTPYVFLEVIAGAGEALHPADYYGEGYDSGGAADITEFIFRGVADKFTRLGGQKIADLDPNGPAGAQFSPAAWGMMPADKAVVFFENHDTQRQGGLGWRDGAVYQLANVWMLAQPYGYPSILSGYAFDPSTQAGRDMGPPSDATGATKSVTCPAVPGTTSIANGEWTCEHRIPAILRMVSFRRYVAGTDVNHWWSNGANAIAFSRGARGFVAINREVGTVTATVGTGLAAGSYCDLLTGGKSGGSCIGTTVTVAADGSVALSLASNTAVAIDGATKL